MIGYDDDVRFESRFVLLQPLKDAVERIVHERNVFVVQRNGFTKDAIHRRTAVWNFGHDVSFANGPSSTCSAIRGVGVKIVKPEKLFCRRCCVDFVECRRTDRVANFEELSRLDLPMIFPETFVRRQVVAEVFGPTGEPARKTKALG